MKKRLKNKSKKQTKKKVKDILWGRRKIILDGNLDINKEMENTVIIKHTGNYKPHCL